MKYFVISDTHFNHSNIIGYCSRPFIDVKDMNEAIIENWNRVVTDFDVVYHVGDFGFGDYNELASIYKRLKGKRKILIQGNHDRSIPQLYQMGWDAVLKEVVVGCGNYGDVLLRHEPLPKPERINCVVHGHIHDKPSTTCNVSVEKTNYQPILLETAVKQWWKTVYG